MSGYCPVCGETLDDSLACPNRSAHAKHRRTGGSVEVVLPKPSTARRLTGAGAEWLIYQVLCGFIVALSFTNFDFVFSLLLAGLIAIRDSHSGLFSIEKRISNLRVVYHPSGGPISNLDALKRNSYYLLLPLATVLPLFGLDSLFIGLFQGLVLTDVLMIIFRDDGRRLGDLLAGTQVVQSVKQRKVKREAR